MAYKSPPNNSIGTAEQLPAYIDAFLAKRGIERGWRKFKTLMDYRYISTRSRARELGIAVNTLKRWENIYRNGQESDTLPK